MFFSARFSSSTPHTKGRSGKCHLRQWPLPTPPEISAWLVCFCDDQKSVFSYRPFFRTRDVSMRYMYLKLHPGECPHRIPKLFAVLSAGQCVSAAQRGPHVVCLQCGPVALASTCGHFGGVQLRVASLWITFSMCPFVLGAQRSVRARGCGPGSKAKCTCGQVPLRRHLAVPPAPWMLFLHRLLNFCQSNIIAFPLLWLKSNIFSYI